MLRRLLPSVVLLALPLFAGPAAADPPLPKVTVEVQDDTGTMHYADRVTIVDGANPPLVVKLPADAIEKGTELLPLFSSRVLRAGPDRFVLIGWSSTGAGMQTMHAWIVRTADGKKPVIVDRLALTTDRAAAGFVIDARANAVRIGIPWTFDGSLHDAEDWRLRIGSQSKTLTEMRALSFTNANGTLDSYRPPIAHGAFANTRVAWLTADTSGFKPKS